MRKIFFLFLTVLIAPKSYSQISFEKGYFINNSDERTECLIKNIDWKNNPTDFEYRSSDDETTATASIEVVKEFGIYGASKYVRRTVKIDRSSSAISELSKEKNPIFKEEELYLKVLLEGKGSLFYYEEGILKRYFYSVNDSEIEQLVFKRYETDGKDIGFNNHYRQQILNNLKCSNIKINQIESLDYKKNSLISIFEVFNGCSNSESVSFQEKQKKDLFNITLRPRVNSASLDIPSTSFIPNGSFDFGNELNFGFGIEFEYIMPFNKNKWAVAIEPTYQSFKSEKTINVDSGVSGQILTGEVNYNSIEIPLSLRHYMFLDKNSKFFINVSYIIDLSSEDSFIKFKRADNSILNTLELESANNIALGFGYKFKDKLGAEIRYQTSRTIENFANTSTNFNTLSMIIGYSIL